MQDKAENLGLHIVKQGCVPGGTMVALSPRLTSGSQEYFDFIEAVKRAEAEAKAAKRGCWKDLVAERDAKTHEEAAQKLEEQGKLAEAVEEYRKAIATGETHAQTLLNLGECLEKLGRMDEALESYEKAIGDGLWWPPYLSKAQCLEKQQGMKAAVTWLEGIPSKPGEEKKVPYLLGWFHDEAGRPKDAIPHYESVIRIVSAKHGFKFDEDGVLVLDKATLAKDTNDYADTWPTLEELSRCYWKTGQSDAAFKTATMSISIGQQIDRNKTYLDKEAIEAGNVLGRIVRARVFLARMKLDEAMRSTSQRSGTRWATRVGQRRSTRSRRR